MCHMSFVSRSRRSIDGCYQRVCGWRLSVVVMPVWKFVGKAERGTASAASFVHVRDEAHNLHQRVTVVVTDRKSSSLCRAKCKHLIFHNQLVLFDAKMLLT